ncbi:hypothetical protein ACLB1G_05660 [Oxalobacteraceae bacterium A2-2]
MGYRNVLFAALALAVSSLALAGVLHTDAYSQAARSEALGLQALTERLQGEAMICDADQVVQPAAQPAAEATLLSSAVSATVQR